MRVLLVAPTGQEVLGIIGKSVGGALLQLGHQLGTFDFRRGFVIPGTAGGTLKRAIGTRLPFSPRSLPGVRWLEARKKAGYGTGAEG
jgi:hypothetical protein